MNKVLLGVIVVVVLAAALGTAGFVFAQSSTPTAPVPTKGNGYGRMMGGSGMMSGRGMMGGAGQNGAPRYGMGANGVDMGILHDGMIAAYAEKLGLSVDEIDARLAKGETMSQIASSKGLTADQFRTLMSDARSQAIDQAVKSGALTQAQADQMKQRGVGMGYGRSGNMDCPYYSETQE